MELLHKLRAHWREDFRAGYYAAVAVFIGLCIFANYRFFPYFYQTRQTIEGYIIQQFEIPGSLWAMPLYFLFYAFPYFAVVGIYWLFTRDRSFIAERGFWGRTLFILVLMSWNVTSNLYDQIASAVPTEPERYWTRRVVATLTPALFIGIPLLVFWWLRDRDKGDGFYGFRFRQVEWKPYLFLLLLFTPVLVFAAFQPQFTNYYPTLKLQRMEGFTWMPIGTAFGIYEFAYGSYYFWTELVMRGFFVIGLSKYMGKNAVLPMVALYAFRHFEKPWGETVSSVFGGYLLGVWALRSRSIWGGVILHAGIAVGMDLLAWWRLG